MLRRDQSQEEIKIKWRSKIRWDQGQGHIKARRDKSKEIKIEERSKSRRGQG